MNVKLEHQRHYKIWAVIGTAIVIIALIAASIYFGHFPDTVEEEEDAEFNFPPSTIKEEGTGYNDGPWIYFTDDPSTTIEVAWLSAEPDATTLVNYGLSRDSLTQTAEPAGSAC